MRCGEEARRFGAERQAIRGGGRHRDKPARDEAVEAKRAREQLRRVQLRRVRAAIVSAGAILAACAIAAAGPDSKAAGPDFEAAGPDKGNNINTKGVCCAVVSAEDVH